MRKNKRTKQAPGASDTRLAGDLPTANSAEFIPSVDPPQETDGYGTNDTFDFIPDLKGNKYQ